MKCKPEPAAAQKAIKNLRLRLGLSQQAFAAKTGLSISSVTRYEKTRPPKSDVLVMFSGLAEEHGLRDIAEQLREAREAELRAVQMKTTTTFSLPSDLWEWFAVEAAKRRMRKGKMYVEALKKYQREETARQRREENDE